MKNKDFLLITNNSNQTHMGKMTQMAEKANSIVIVSPFVSSDLVSLIERMPTIKYVTIYVNLKGYDDADDKVISLYTFAKYCKDNKIDLQIKADDKLHGKVYLFYNQKKDGSLQHKGFILTSGNFTSNGMRNNHEFGVCIFDVNEQLTMTKMINALKTYNVSFEQLKILADEAEKFKKSKKKTDIEVFNPDKYVNWGISAKELADRKYFLKPLGTAEEPFVEGSVMGESCQIGFSKKLKSVSRGDILICHATGPQMIVGYYMVNCDKQFELYTDSKDRWPYKFDVLCKTVPFSKNWWSYNLKTKDLVDMFLKENPGKHITAKGGDTIGSFNFGSEKIEITKDFAHFILSHIDNA